LNVRVTLVRGRCRDVLVVGRSSSSSSVRVVVCSVDVGLLEVVEDDDDDDDDEDEPEGPSMSVVCGGLVLVIVWVVVASADWESVAEYVGATKSTGACSVSPNWRATAVAARISRPTTISARTLAPSTSGVRLCQGGPSLSSSRRATATDSSRDLLLDACSA
jgi:hypothetical protein